MPWPDIFFKAKKPAETQAPPSPPPEAPKIVEPPPSPAPSKAPPADQIPRPSSQPLPMPKIQVASASDRGTRTFPVMHGVVLRPVTRPSGRVSLAPPPPEPIKNIEQLMTEADPVKTLSQTGSIRLMKRLTPETPALRPPTSTLAGNAPAAPSDGTVIAPPKATEAASPWPSFAAKEKPAVVEPAKAHPIAPLENKKPEPPAAPASPAPQLPRSVSLEATFLARGATAGAVPQANRPPPPALPPMISIGSIARRKAKLADVARIILPPKREETGPLPPNPAQAPTSGSAPAATPAPAAPPADAPETKAAEPAVPIIIPPAFTFVPKTDYEAPKLDPALVFDPATMPAQTGTVTEAPAFETLPQLEAEAHQAPPPATTNGPRPTSTEIEPAIAPGTREFHLTNGERVAGVVLSETPDTLYVEHATLGVLTIPRSEIATRLAEIILINGDRIVGNIMAETPDMLYVRHASLGMLSVPKAQRSRRVVEAILKNGDRILGEVLTETETFTVIKSATLGTVTVPHSKVSMLNRKIEQIEMKALPAAAAQLTA